MRFGKPGKQRAGDIRFGVPGSGATPNPTPRPTPQPTQEGQLSGLIPEVRVIFDPNLGHNHDGDNSRLITIGGDAQGTNDAVTVEKVQNVPIDAPVTDGYVPYYNAGANEIKWQAPGSPAFFFRQAGTSPNEIWYAAGVDVQVAFDSIASLGLLADQLLAIPFYSGRGGTLDRIGFNVSSVAGVGGKARAGIYANTSDTVIYPAGLVVDGGEQDIHASTGMKSSTINVTLQPNALYWLALTVGTSSTGQFKSLQNGVLTFGLGSDLGSLICFWNKPRTYAALPDPYPSGASAADGGAGVPLIGVRYSS